MKTWWADFKVWILNTWHKYSMWTKLFFQHLTHDLKLDGNHDLRIFVFVFVYVVFSAIGAYNFAQLTAFLYIIWLLERKA